MSTGADSDRFHPQYRALHAELLARPYPVVSGLVIVSHRAIHFTSGEATAHHAAVTVLGNREDVAASPAEKGIQLLRFGDVELRIEGHPEFTTFTVFAPQTGAPFAESALDRLPEGLLDGIPGRIFAAVEIASELVANGDAGTVKTMERVSEYFGQERLVGGWVVERVASVWSHLHLDQQGATRFLIQIHRLTSGRYGRLLQRLLEIETYRMAAMLGLPPAHEVLPGIEALEERRVRLVGRIRDMEEGGERALLEDLTDLSIAAGRLHSRYGSQLRQTEEYVRRVSTRVRELREEQVPGYQTFGEFFDRRLIESLSACERAQAGLGSFSASMDGTTQLLRASVELTQGNHLATAKEVPEAVPPPSWHRYVDAILTVVLTYCLAGILKIMIEGVRVIGIPLNASLVTALALPFLGYGVWRALQYAKAGSEE